MLNRGDVMEVFIFGTLLCVIVGIIADGKGRSGFGFFMLSFFLTPIVGMIALLVVGKKEKKK
jgi:hypothetical protein